MLIQGFEPSCHQLQYGVYFKGFAEGPVLPIHTVVKLKSDYKMDREGVMEISFT